MLLDANMPDMDGFAVAEQMAAHPELGGATIMMLTSSGQFGDSTRCRELGIRAYLTKPIRQTDLFDAISRTLQPQTAPHGRSSCRSMRPRARFARARILLAEDNVVNQRVAVGLLTRRGHSVDVANNGLEALAALGSVAVRRRADGHPDARDGRDRGDARRFASARRRPGATRASSR